MAKKKPGPSTRDTFSSKPIPMPPEQKGIADAMRRRIFLNLFRHNSTRINSARYESGWRFTISICWREGDPVPCPAAVGHEDTNRTGHHVDVDFHVAIADLAISIGIRVDDGVLLNDFAKIGGAGRYVPELREVLERRFGLSYPKVEDDLK